MRPTTWYSRPDPPGPVDGYVWAALPDEVWRTQNWGTCRYTVGPNHKQCAATAVAALNRGRYTRQGRQPSWWAYCADHMYGHWIENGQVLAWCLVAEGEDE